MSAEPEVFVAARWVSSDGFQEIVDECYRWDPRTCAAIQGFVVVKEQGLVGRITSDRFTLLVTTATTTGYRGDEQEPKPVLPGRLLAVPATASLVAKTAHLWTNDQVRYELRIAVRSLDGSEPDYHVAVGRSITDHAGRLLYAAAQRNFKIDGGAREEDLPEAEGEWPTEGATAPPAPQMALAPIPTINVPRAPGVPMPSAGIVAPGSPDLLIVGEEPPPPGLMDRRPAAPPPAPAAAAPVAPPAALPPPAPKAIPTPTPPAPPAATTAPPATSSPPTTPYKAGVPHWEKV